MPHRQEARLLFPGGAAYEFESFTGGSTLSVDGTYPYDLFELVLTGDNAQTLDLKVSDTRIVDPYEEVVKNQVFQERQLERFESLDVMEYLTNVFHPGQLLVVRLWLGQQRRRSFSGHHDLGSRFSRPWIPSLRRILSQGRADGPQHSQCATQELDLRGFTPLPLFDGTPQCKRFQMREDWRAWGLDGGAASEDSFQVARASFGGFWRIGESDNLSVATAYWKGWGLDRFSRHRNGSVRIGLAGFGDGGGSDEAVVTSATWGTHIWKTPINLRLDNSYEWLDDTRDTEGAIHRVRLRFQFLINGPFKLDIWPSVRYVISSTIPSEEDEVSFGLFLQRRQ